MDNPGTATPLSARQAGFSYGRCLTANPYFIHMPVARWPTAGSFGNNNPLNEVLRWAPGWYNFGGSDCGTISNGADVLLNPVYMHGTVNATAIGQGARINNTSGKLKGLVCPIPFAPGLLGRRVRVRIGYNVNSTSAASNAGLSALFHGAIESDDITGLGTPGAKTFTPGGTGCGHLIGHVPLFMPGGGSGGPFGMVYSSGSIYGRVSSYNRVFDSWDSAGDSVTWGLGAPPGGWAGAVTHKLFYLDYITSGTNVNQIHAEVPGDNAFHEIDTVFQIPASGLTPTGHPDFLGVVYMTLLATGDYAVAAGGTAVTNIHYCTVELMDDVGTAGPYTSGVSGWQDPFMQGHMTGFHIAYPVYRPREAFLPGKSFFTPRAYGYTISPGSAWASPSMVHAATSGIGSLELTRTYHPPHATVLLASTLVHGAGTDSSYQLFQDGVSGSLDIPFTDADMFSPNLLGTVGWPGVTPGASTAYASRNSTATPHQANSSKNMVVHRAAGDECYRLWMMLAKNEDFYGINLHMLEDPRISGCALLLP